MNYAALDIACHVINYSHDIKYPVSNLKLQKLLYFIQGFSLAAANTPIFSEEIEAWGFGPVVPSVYHTFKKFGSNNIPKVKSYYHEYAESFVDYNDNKIADYDKEFIDSIVNMLKKYSATDLVEITHVKGSPWDQVYSPNKKNIKISNGIIKEYFKKEYEKKD